MESPRELPNEASIAVMNGRTGETNPPQVNKSPRRLSHWIVGSLLLVLVVVLVGAAFLLNASLRPKVGSDVVTAAPVQAQDVGGQSRSPVPSSVPTTVVTTVPGAAARTGPGQASGTPTADQNARQAVATAYLHYWDVYNQALYDLNTAPLSEVMAGQELTRVQAQVDGLRSEKHAVQSDIQHKFIVVNADHGSGAIQDELVVKSVIIDFDTKEALQSPGAGITETIACQMELRDGAWKVKSVVRVEQ